jgi:TP901 family phage tail tape measure protein
MANTFTLFGELKADTGAFERSLLQADKLLSDTAKAIGTVEQQAQNVGKTSAATARQFEKFNDTVNTQRQRVLDAAEAFRKGDIGARQFANVINQAENRAGGLNSRLKDTSAQLTDFGNRMSKAGGAFKSFLSAGLATAGIVSITGALKDFGAESIRLFATLDKLTRFTATLDRNFQSPEALAKFQKDIKELSTEIPHSAESIAKASFTIKSAFANITEPQLIEFLRQFGNAATASNTDIASHAQNVAALAKQYQITAEQLPKFNALIASSFGAALASDAEVASGFNLVLNAAKSVKQPLEDVVAAMSTLQSVSSNAAANTNLLQNVFSKLTDPKYIEGFADIGVKVFDAQGQFRALNDIVNDLSKSFKGLTDQQINEKLSFLKDIQAREGFKALAREVEAYNKQLREGGDEEAFARKNELMLNSAEAKWERFNNKVNNFKFNVGAMFVDVAEYPLGDEILKSLARAKTATVPAATSSGFSIGTAIGLGMGQGINSMADYVVQNAKVLAASAAAGAMVQLGIHSPSKVFFKIGTDTVQGFIDGIAALRVSAQKAMADVVDVRNIKGAKFTGKADAAGLELLSSLAGELARSNAETKVQETLLDLTAGKYGKLNPLIKERILLLAQESDRLQSVKEGLSTLNDTWDEFLKDRQPVLSAVDQLNKTLADPQVVAGLKSMNAELASRIQHMLKIAAIERDQDAGDSLLGPGRNLGEGVGLPTLPEGTTPPFINDIPPPPTAPWDTFFGHIHESLNQMRGSVKTFSQDMGDTIGSSLLGIGDVFAGAVTRWDGTLKGFFTSVAADFSKWPSR